MASSAGHQPIALFVNVDEVAQYRLSGITFKNNRAISNGKALRRLFPIEDGDVFSREKIGKGLENLRYAYLEIGYLNFTSVPDTLFDDERGTISLEIDVDEGKTIPRKKHRDSGAGRICSAGDSERLPGRQSL